MFVELRDTLAKLGGKLLVSVLRNMLVGKVRLAFIATYSRTLFVVAQDNVTPQECAASAPLAPLITAKDALIDFNTMKAEDIVRRHRALCHQVRCLHKSP
jgi:methionyl-tRNA formyltransferase